MDSIRDDKPASTDPDDTKAGLLNGSDPRLRTGTSLLLKVMAGDQVQMNVNTYYDQYDYKSDQPVSATDMLSSIISVLTHGEGGFGGSESHDPTLVGKLFTSGNYNALGKAMEDVTDPEKPRAYLNYILFDENMKAVRTFTGAFQADGDGTWAEIGTTEPLVIPVNGYLAVFESNASVIACSSCTPENNPANVWFDLLKVQFSRGNLKEETHYYPYGLPMAGRGGTASGFLPNRRKYQSNEYIQDAGLSWMDFHARQYDPQLGRFMGIDPLADGGGQERLSPYAAMGNNPVSATDPLGLQYQDRADPRFPSEPLHPQYVPSPNPLFNMLATGQMRGFSITWFDGSSFTALVAYANSLAGINDATMGDDKTKKNTNNNGSSQGQAASNFASDGYQTGEYDKATGDYKIIWHSNSKPTFLERAYLWYLGLNFHFSIEGKLTYGAQLGLIGEIAGRKLGGEGNLASITLLSGKADVTTNLSNGTSSGTTTGNYINKDGTMEVSQGVKAGIGAVGAGVERTFNSGSMPNDQLKTEFDYGMSSLEHTSALSPDAKIANPKGAYLNLNAGVKVLLGVDLNIKIGFSH